MQWIQNEYANDYPRLLPPLNTRFTFFTIPSGKRQIFAWALYDWANSAFATTVMAGFFPIFFKQYWSQGLSSTESTFQLGLGNSMASLLIVLGAPLLGAIADCGGLHKRFLLSFASLGVLATGGMALVGQGDWLLAVMLFVAASVGFMGANVFYDALLVSVADEADWNWVSSFGYALGYLGGGVLFSVNVAMTLSPESFGLADASEAVRLSFVSVAIWWALFALPLMFWVKAPLATVPASATWANTVRAGYVQLRDTFHQLRKLRTVFLFLLAYWFYIDGVDTIVRMAVDYGLSIGLQQSELITALLITQFVGFPAAIGFAFLAQRIGARNGIFLALAVYSIATIAAFFMQSSGEFYALAVTIGLVQGGVQALSRSLYARMIPPGKAAEFFGFYNMLGKFAAVLGPLLVGTVSVLTGSHRWGLVSVVVLFVIGAALLARVDVKEAERLAKNT
ncbi:MAG: MFS transporter [Gammaproteobacteria bacterium]|nr:MFS transporter [Gammaproteobacteria bacterium]